MQRINLSIDLSDEEILGKEINAAIEGAVRGRTRDFFNKEMQEICKEKEERLKRKWEIRWGGEDRYDRLVRQTTEKLVHKTLEKEDVKIALQVNNALGNLNSIVKEEVAKAISCISMEEIIREEIRKVVPTAVMEVMKMMKDNEKPE